MTLSGSVKIGSGSHIGTGASVIHGVEIGSRVIVGASSVVNTIQDNKKVMGVPGR